VVSINWDAMRTTSRKEVLTTGEVARICHVAPRTVSKWFDTGKLRGYRIPGSRDRRIPVDQLIAFMRAHEIPLDGLDGGACRILIMDPSIPRQLVRALAEGDRYEVRIADNGFDAGLAAQRFHPHVILLDASDMEAEAVAICRNVRAHAELQGVKLLAAVSRLDGSKRDRFTAMGFDGCLAKPYSLKELTIAIEKATNLIA